MFSIYRGAKLGNIQGGCRFDKGGGGLEKNLNFYAIKIPTFWRFYAKQLKKAYILKKYYAKKSTNFSQNQGGFNPPPFQNSRGVATPPLWRPCLYTSLSMYI